MGSFFYYALRVGCTYCLVGVLVIVLAVQCS